MAFDRCRTALQRRAISGKNIIRKLRGNMAKQTEKFDNLTARTRYFRCLLYPDNPQHAAAISLIKSGYAEQYLGIVHKAAEDGEKEHHHIVLVFDNPRITSSVCTVLGLVDASGAPDDQFCRAIVKKQDRPVDQQLSSCCVYLTHRNAPEKEQYSLDDLYGTEELRRKTAKWVLKTESKEFDMPDSVLAVLDWISSQDNIIKAYSFGRWLANSPYWKANNNRIVWSALKEHNLRIWQEQNPVPGHFDCVDPKDRIRTDEDAELARMGFVWFD